FDPRAAIVPGIVAASVSGAHEIFGASTQNLFLVDRMNAALVAHQECRAAPNTYGPKRQSGDDAAPVTNSAGRYHRLRSNRIDDLRNHWGITNGAGLAPRFLAVCGTQPLTT